jgi:hypothetical protein
MKTNWKDSLKDLFQYGLAACIVLGFFNVLAKLFDHDIPIANTQVTTLLVGFLGGMVTTVVAYFFASNKDSAKKTDMLYNSIPTKVTPPITSADTTTTTTETTVAEVPPIPAP